MQELSSIRRLSDAGSAQLAADLDYFCNVLAALGVNLPPQLVTWQVRLLPRCFLPLCVIMGNSPHGTLLDLHPQKDNIERQGVSDSPPMRKRMAHDYIGSTD